MSHETSIYVFVCIALVPFSKPIYCGHYPSPADGDGDLTDVAFKCASRHPDWVCHIYKVILIERPFDWLPRGSVSSGVIGLMNRACSSDPSRFISILGCRGSGLSDGTWKKPCQWRVGNSPLLSVTNLSEAPAHRIHKQGFARPVWGELPQQLKVRHFLITYTFTNLYFESIRSQAPKPLGHVYGWFISSPSICKAKLTVS